MVEFQRIGYKSELIIKRSLLVSKFLTRNSYTIPSCRHISVMFPLYESLGILKSKSIMIMVNFLEQLTGVRGLVERANLIVGSGLWVQGQVNLSSFRLMTFLVSFNEIFIVDPQVRFSTRPPILRILRKNYVKLLVYNIDFFFETFTRRLLPQNNFFWLEFNFYYDDKTLDLVIPISFYTQFFFSHNFSEWQDF